MQPRRELTPRETTVGKLIADGLTNAEIARSLSISETTVKRYVQNVCMKLERRNRAHVAAYFCDCHRIPAAERRSG
ncbi:MAG: helix-turn-helix transcriptional regulator [Dehalococcoidia bacterium]